MHRFDLMKAGNALLIKKYVEDNFPPLVWNVIMIQNIALIMKKKVNPTKLDESSFFDKEIIDCINKSLIEKTGKGLSF